MLTIIFFFVHLLFIFECLFTLYIAKTRHALGALLSDYVTLHLRDGIFVMLLNLLRKLVNPSESSSLGGGSLPNYTMWRLLG